MLNTSVKKERISLLSFLDQEILKTKKDEQIKMEIPIIKNVKNKSKKQIQVDDESQPYLSSPRDRTWDRGGSRRVAKFLSGSNTFHSKSKAIKMLSCKNLSTLLDPPLSRVKVY